MGKRILIIDDDPVVRILLTEYLAAHGHLTTVAESGKEALAHLDTGERPDLILLDMILPDMNGLQLLALIKGASATAEVPVALLSANTVADTSVLISQSKMTSDFFLQKPFDLRSLDRIVDAIAPKE